MIKNPIVKNVLWALIVAVIGFILLSLTFLFDFLYQSAVRGIVQLFIPMNPEMDIVWFPWVMHGSFMILICLISWAIFRTKWHKLIKATYLSVPTAVVLATIGIMFYRWPVVVYIVGFALCAGVLYYFYRTKQHWIYYFTVIFWALVLAIFTLMGGEI